MKLDVTLAWNRVKKDLKDKNFIAPIFLPQILQTDADKWLVALKAKLETGQYHPHSMEVIEIPKGKGLIRPGSLLTIQDNIYYSCLVQECYLRILKRIKWSQNSVDFAYIPTEENSTSNEWYQKHLVGWAEFRNNSLNLIKSGYQYVIVTDLTGFYDNIDIATLISDIRSCEIDEQVVSALSNCLNKWAQVAGKGIPQSNSASDLLAKLYLDAVDKGMKNAGFVHLRYVDDIRIFCKTKNEAKKALMELSRLLRKRGLNLQSSKTQILPANEAAIEIEGIQPVINSIADKLREEALSFFTISSYADEEEETDEEETPIEIIKATFNTYFIERNDGKFDKTLFHFLINRLIKEKDSYALDYCLSILDRHPEETEYILKYSNSFHDFEIWLGSLDLMRGKLIDFLKSEDCVYDYQNFQILSWFSKNMDDMLSANLEDLITICRKAAFDNNKPYYLRSIARYILGKYGNIADVDKLEETIHYTSSEMEKAELICCLQKMEKGKRNSLLGRLSKEGEILEMAVIYAKKA